MAGAAVGMTVGGLMGPPYDVILIFVGALAGYKLAPRRRRTRL